MGNMKYSLGEGAKPHDYTTLNRTATQPSGYSFGNFSRKAVIVDLLEAGV